MKDTKADETYQSHHEDKENNKGDDDNNGSLAMLLRAANYIQSIKFRGKTIIGGLDLVILGTAPASESVTIFGVRPPRYPFYMLSGTLCDFVQFFIDYFLYKTIGLEDPSICWALGFGMSIVVRHSSHRYLVFGRYVGGYWHSLGRMYLGYSIIIVLSTIFNLVMTKVLFVSHYVAWVITLLWTGLVNYFILKKLWSFGGNESSDKKVEDDLEDEVLLESSMERGGG